jgi:hypothetical protein
MTPSSTYTLAALPAWNPAGWVQRRLLAEGRPLPVFVDGDGIGLQLRYDAFTLLATNYDYFDGCHNWIYLLDQDGNPLDQLRLPDYFGFIEKIEVCAPNEVAFGYMGTQDRWRVVVHPQGYWSYTLTTMSRRLNRFLLSRRYLSVQRSKG